MHRVCLFFLFFNFLLGYILRILITVAIYIQISLRHMTIPLVHLNIILISTFIDGMWNIEDGFHSNKLAHSVDGCSVCWHLRE